MTFATLLQRLSTLEESNCL